MSAFWDDLNREVEDPQFRAEYIEAVREIMTRLDGTQAAAIAEMTGLTPAEINDLGGI